MGQDASVQLVALGELAGGPAIYRTWRGLTTATGDAAAAKDATKGSSKPPVASRITAVGFSTCNTCNLATSVSSPALSYGTLQFWSAGRVATSTLSLATSMPTQVNSYVMFTSPVVVARPCKMRAWSALATVRALLGMSAATLAFRRPYMTKIRSVCRTRDQS